MDFLRASEFIYINIYSLASAHDQKYTIFVYLKSVIFVSKPFVFVVIKERELLFIVFVISS